MNIYDNSIQIDGFCIETDDALGLGLRNGAPFEPEVLMALRRFISPGSMVLDIGANVGYFTAQMSRLVGPSGIVHAFEPEPRNFALLQRNKFNNRLDNVELHQLALGHQTELVKIFISEFNGGHHRLYESVCCSDNTLNVSMRRLDSMFSPGQIAVIKIDVEGFEPFVFEGASRLIVDQEVTIISEYCPPAMLEAGVSIVDFLLILKRWGLVVAETDGRSIDWVSLIEDANKWDRFGRKNFSDACRGKSIPEISNIVERLSEDIGCRRPYIENLVFQANSLKG